MTDSSGQPLPPSWLPVPPMPAAPPLSWPAPPPFVPASDPIPPRRRGGAVAVVAAFALLCGGFGVALGAHLGGSSAVVASPSTSSATAPSGAAVLPTTPSTAANTHSLSTAAVAALVDPAIVDITTTLTNGAAAGTGIVLTSSGLVLTNNHVIADATSINAQVDGTGTTYTAHVLGYDVTEDVALVQLDGAANLATVTVGDSDAVSVGDRVIALGNALGQGGTPAVAEGAVTGVEQTITAGDVNGSSETLHHLIEISAPLQPGDSGGPLVSGSGQVIGMSTAASASGRRRATDAYAIPINGALAIARQIQAGQSSATVHIGDRGLLGVEVDGTAPTATSGVAIAAVQDGGPAQAAGLAAGDVITAINGTTVSSSDALRAALDAFHPGDRVDVAWTDSTGASHTATVTLTVGPPA